MELEQLIREWLDKTLRSPSFLSAIQENLEIQKQLRSKLAFDADKTSPSDKKDLKRLVALALLLESKITEQNEQLISLEKRVKSLEKELILTRIENTKSKIARRIKEVKN